MWEANVLQYIVKDALHMRQQRYARSAALLLLLLLALVGCGKTATAGGDPSSPVISLGTPTPSNLRGAHIGGLYVTTGDFSCVGSTNVVKGANLVLATSNLSLDAGEAQQVHSYIQQIAQNSTGTVDANSFPSPPAALRWIPGGAHCSEELDIANTSKAAIQISGVGFQVLTAPQPNTNQYRLVTVAKNNNNPCPKNGSGGCGGKLPCAYTAQATLDASGNNAQVNAQMQGQSQSREVASCPVPFVMQPQDVQPIMVDVTDRYTRALIYHNVIPTIDEVTSSGARHLVINTLKEDFTFTSTDQLSCYTLQNNTFVLNRSDIKDCI
jgi:hypothetical protein